MISPKFSSLGRTCRDLCATTLQLIWGLALIFALASLLACAIVYPIFLFETWGR